MTFADIGTRCSRYVFLLFFSEAFPNHGCPTLRVENSVVLVSPVSYYLKSSSTVVV